MILGVEEGAATDPGAMLGAMPAARRWQQWEPRDVGAFERSRIGRT